MLPDWFFLLLRGLAVASLAVGAYRGFRQLRTTGRSPALAGALYSTILVLFIVTKTLAILAYFILVWPHYVITAIASAVVWIAGGLRLIGWLLGRIYLRLDQPV
jgi:hypothetical protein